MKRITAIHPDGTTNTSFNGAVGPIHFQNGVVELHTDEHDAYVAYCAINAQFKVEHEADATEATPADPADLKGKALDAALDEAGLSKDGKADEKRARLVEHAAAQAATADALVEPAQDGSDLPDGDAPADDDPSGESDN